MAVRISGINALGIKTKQPATVPYTTFDTSPTWNNALSDPIYTNNDLTVYLPSGSAPTAAGQARSVDSFSTGRVYTEITINSLQSTLYPAVGIIPASIATTTTLATTLPYGWYGRGLTSPVPSTAGPPVLIGKLSGNYGTVWQIGDTIGILVDNDTHTLTFYKNGISMGVATSSLPSGEYRMWARSAGTGFAATVTANFGASPFLYPIPGASGVVAL